MSTHWVVVGAGSGGCVAAARLSEHPSNRVTVLDAGPDLAAGAVPPTIAGPDFFAALAEPGRVDDGILAARVRGDAPRPYPIGRGVGGSSAVNAMLAQRGSAARYRTWGWHDAADAWGRVAIPAERVGAAELGDVDRALLAADPAAEPAALTRRDGRRVTSAEAYLWPAVGRGDVEVRAEAPVERIVVADGRAVGVQLADGTELAADRVVVAAGAIRTPALLLRSGIVAPGIGAGLQDHPAVAFTLDLHDRPPPGGLAIGALAEHDGVQLLALNHLGPGEDVAGLGMVMVALLTPMGRGGTVTIDDAGAPQVDVAMLDDARDVAALARGVRHALDALRAPAFEELVAEVYVDDHGTTRAALTDDEAVERWVRTANGGYVHAVGTCAMGSVVDDAGAVVGYDALYVCDASVFPAIPDAAPHLPTTMLAERLSARWMA